MSLVGHGKNEGKLTPFSDIKGMIPGIGAFGISIDTAGDPWMLIGEGYNWERFLISQSRSSLGAGVLTLEQEAQDQVVRYGVARSNYIKAARSLYEQNGIPDKGWRDLTQLTWTAEAWVTENYKVYHELDEDEVFVQFPVDENFRKAIENLGVKPPYYLAAIVNRKIRLGYFVNSSFQTYGIQVFANKLSDPAKLGSLIASWVALALAAATLNVPGIIAAAAQVGLTVGAAAAQTSDAIALALKAEGVVAEAAKSQDVKQVIQVAKQVEARQNDVISGEDFPLWTIGLAGGALLLAYLFS